MTGKEYFSLKTGQEQAALQKEYRASPEGRHNRRYAVVLCLLCAVLLVLLVLSIAKLIVPSFDFNVYPVFMITVGVASIFNAWYAFNVYPKFYKWIEENKLSENDDAEK